MPSDLKIRSYSNPVSDIVLQSVGAFELKMWIFKVDSSIYITLGSDMSEFQIFSDFCVSDLLTTLCSLERKNMKVLISNQSCIF